MSGIVDGREDVGVDVVHGFTVEYRLGESQWVFAALAHSFSPVFEGQSRLGGRVDAASEPGKNFQAFFSGEPEDGFGEILVELGCADTPVEFVRVEGGRGFQIEMSLTDEDGASDDSLDRT